MTSDFTFTGELREWDGPAAWYFLLLPEEVADDIADLVEGRPRAGFGSVRVDVTVGVTSWRTSIFPSKQDGTYLLPVKRSVREAESLGEGDRPEVTLTIVGD
jgi:hypothetical protein